MSSARSCHMPKIMPSGCFTWLRRPASNWAQISTPMRYLTHCGMRCRITCPTGGVHERRGTLLACAANGLPVVGKTDWATPEFLLDYVRAAATPADALFALEELSGNLEALAAQSKRSTELDKLFSWDSITSGYITLFEGLLGRHKEGGHADARGTSQQEQRAPSAGSES